MAKSSTSIKPGERRNPSGRPPRTEAENEALEILRAATPAAARALVLALDGPESVKAAIALLDRVLGKPASAPEDRESMAGAIRPAWLDELDTAAKIELIRRATEKKE